MNSEKSVYYCLVVTLWKCRYCFINSEKSVYYCLFTIVYVNSLKVSLLFDINSEKSVYYCLVVTLQKCQYCLIWTLKKCLLLPGSSWRKISVYCLIWTLRKVFTVAWYQLSESVSVVWYELWKKCLLLLRSNSLKVSVGPFYRYFGGGSREGST